jgi:FixJ family two-component response regulator
LAGRINHAVRRWNTRRPKTGKSTMGQTLISLGGGYQGPKPADEIFVVDDDENMRDVLEATLAPEGFRVTGFEDGDSFLQAASTRLPLCVFLDVVMPRRSGLEILKELRARQYRTPIFLMSARDDAPTVVEGMRNGAYDYMTKPFDRHSPILRVRDAVEVWSAREQKASVWMLQPNPDDEWVRLAPHERDALSLMRLMDTVCK